MKKNTISIFMISIFALFSLVGNVWSRSMEAKESNSMAGCTLLSGEYRDLTWYRSVKIGLSSFVEPDFSAKTAITNVYNVDDILRGTNDIKLSHDLIDGKMWLAKNTGKAYETIPVAVFVGDFLPGIDPKLFASINSTINTPVDPKANKILIGAVTKALNLAWKSSGQKETHNSEGDYVFLGYGADVKEKTPAKRVVSWDVGSPVINAGLVGCPTINGNSVK